MVSESRAAVGAPETAFVLDLDGTLVDSVYQHVMAWRQALSDVGVPFSVWQVHRRIGMSGGLLVEAVSREAGKGLTDAESEKAKALHDRYYAETVETISPLPGARELIRNLRECEYKWAIATSGHLTDAEPMLELLGLTVGETQLVTSEDVSAAKPDPQLFLTAARLLDVDPASAVVLGDSVWDMLAARRAGCIGIGLMSGGFSSAELIEAHSFRVYADAADFLRHVDELGVRFPTNKG